MVTAIVGINWGDEGKGRMVDLFASQYDVVIRFQGGNNAGHTVINEYGKFALNLMPSGIFTKNVISVIGNGAVIDPQHLLGEIERLRAGGVHVGPDNFKISDRASIVFPYHRQLDALEEERLKDHKFGSTKRGIAPVYSDKYQKKTLQMGEALYREHMCSRLAMILDWKNLILKNVYNAEPVAYNDMLEYIDKYVVPLAPYITDVTEFLNEAYSSKKSILFEAQLGALRDLDLGIYPYTSSSSPLACYAPLGSGAPFIKLDNTVGIVKAYSTCVGEGPFVAEWFGDEAEKLRAAGGEYGAATGRPRRVGPIDLVATRYGVMLQAATEIALTKLDVLSYMTRLPICNAYKLADGTTTSKFPFTPLLDGASPVIEYMDGFMCDISKIRRYEELPKAARDYVEFIEENIGAKITYVSVGAERDEIIRR